MIIAEEVEMRCGAFHRYSTFGGLPAGNSQCKNDATTSLTAINHTTGSQFALVVCDDCLKGFQLNPHITIVNTEQIVSRIER
jgi:hypothetical protein